MSPVLVNGHPLDCGGSETAVTALVQIVSGLLAEGCSLVGFWIFSISRPILLVLSKLGFNYNSQ
jgi:hypothetical protein